MSLFNSLTSGGNVKVTIERPDGTIYEMNAIMVEMSVHVDTYPTSFGGMFSSVPQRVSMQLEGIDLRLFDQNGYKKHTIEQRSSQEWKCPYCWLVNPKSARYCGQDDKNVGCGAVRPFIYED